MSVSVLSRIASNLVIFLPRSESYGSLYGTRSIQAVLATVDSASVVLSLYSFTSTLTLDQMRGGSGGKGLGVGGLLGKGVLFVTYSLLEAAGWRR